MKFLKLLFSKIFVTALALIVQVLLILVVLLFFERYFWQFQILSAIFGILIFLYMVSRKESPEFKLPWMFILLVLPFFGAAIYCLFGRPHIADKQYRLMLESVARLKKYSAISEEESAAIAQFLGEGAGIENYLKANAFSRGHLNNKVEYFGWGEDFYADLLCELEKAERFIFMEYFIIDRGRMWDGIHEILKRKAAAGVEVRIMYDDIGCAGLLKSGFCKSLKKEGINCVKFNPFRPVVSGIHNNRDHRKITVIDGKVGYTGGVNIADEYINGRDRFGIWKDTAVKIRGSAVGNLTVLFLQLFDVTAQTLSDCDKYLNVEYEAFEGGGYVHPFGDGPNPLYKELVGSNNYINIINSAKKYVYISTPYLIPDYNLISALRNAAFRGVDVRIITPHVPDKKIIFNMTRSNYKFLLESGVKIYEYTPGFIHAKEAVADGVTAFVGTINLDYRSLVHHYECGVVLHQAPCIKDIEESFKQTLSVSLQVAPNFKMGFFEALSTSVFNLFSPML